MIEITDTDNTHQFLIIAKRTCFLVDNISSFLIIIELDSFVGLNNEYSKHSKPS